MCLKYFDDEQMKCVLGGFENGEILCWDVTNPNEETSKVKLFSEPGTCMQQHLCSHLNSFLSNLNL